MIYVETFYNMEYLSMLKIYQHVNIFGPKDDGSEEFISYMCSFDTFDDYTYGETDEEFLSYFPKESFQTVD